MENDQSREIFRKVSGNRSYLPQNPADLPKTTNNAVQPHGWKTVLEYSQFLYAFYFEVVINIPKEGLKSFFKSYKVVSHGK